MYSNEAMDLLNAIEVEPQTEVDAPNPPQKTSNRAPSKQDRRLERQFRRLDQMVARRDMQDNAITTIDGIPNLVFSLPDQETHHWSDFRRAIRNARRDGFAFFSIDNFIGYGIFYRNEGITEEHIARFRDPYVAHVQNELQPGGAAANDFLLVREVPMREEYDLEGFPIMRFFSYDIPQVAKYDLLRHRLVVTAVVNWGRLDRALVDEGFGVVGINVTPDDQSLPYSVDVSWPTGDTFRIKTPMSQVSCEVERALYEFSGLDDVVRKVGSLKLLPETISYEDWDASLKAQATDDDAGQQTKAK
jgi:hypothetical protein